MNAQRLQGHDGNGEPEGTLEDAAEGSVLTSLNPATGGIVWQGREASDAQVERAVRAAAEVLPSWRATRLEDRMAIVRAYGAQLAAEREEVASLITRETGKLPTDARAEVATSVAKVELSIRALEQRRADFSGELSGAAAEIRYRSLGVVVVLGPFNFPLHLPGGQIIPALLAGNSIVFKPSEYAPAVGHLMVEAWKRAGLPSGVMQIVQGGPRVAQSAIAHPATQGVMFTGSYRGGQAIHRQLAGRPDVLLALEMGGNNPLVVLEPGNVQLTAGAICASAFASSGQRCTCTRRLFVVDHPHADALLVELAGRVQRLRSGLPGDDPEPFIGPLISSHAATQVLQAEARYRLAGGGSLVAIARCGRSPALLSPGLIDMTEGAHEVEDEEVFGPLLQVYRCRSFEAAVALARKSRYGLAAALFGGTRSQFETFRDCIGAGIVNWNRPTTGASGGLPFGGLGASGNHRPAGFWMIDACNDPVVSLRAEVIHDDGFDRSQL